MGKSKGGQQEVNEYQLSQHIGFCHGPLDYITRVWYGEKVFWKGALTNQTSMAISKPNLFGGPKKEGGVSGVIDFLFGKADQILPDRLAARLGRPSGAQTPGFRGVTSLFCTDTSGGFTWQANTPYLKSVWLTGVRAPKGVGLDSSVSLLFEQLDQSEIIPMDDVWKYLEGPIVGGAPPNADLYTDPSFDDSGWLQGRQPFANDTHPQAGPWPSTPNTVIEVQHSLWLRKQVTVPAPGEALIMTIFVDNEVTIYWNGVKAGYVSVQHEVPPIYTEFEPFELVVDTLWRVHINIPGELVQATNFVAAYFQDDTYAPGPGIDYFAAGVALVQPEVVTEEVRADANPSHIVYEVMTNTDFGLGDSPDLFDIDSFNDCAQKLYDEKLMLSMQWTRQSSVEEFNNEVLKHINGLVFTNPRTGLHTIRLIRGGYDESTLRQLNPENSKITKFSRRVWGQTTNEITVTWTNPVTEKEETVTVQDQANISIQGKVITSSRNYYGVRSRPLATELAYRELRVAGSPLCTVEIEMDRTAWDILPGDVVALTWPEYDLTALPMRVGTVDYGQIGASSIRVNMTEDVFALPISHFEVAPPSPWNPSGLSPAAVFSKQLFTLPAYATGAIAPDGLAALPYPSAYMGIAAQAPNADSSSFELMGQTTLPNGDTGWVSKGTLNFTSKANLTNALVAEAVSVVNGFSTVVGEGATVAGFMMIGSGTEEQIEFALVQSYDSSTGYTFKRGVLDTVPRNWPVGTKVWFITIDSFAYDQTELAAGVEPSYKFLTNTTKGQLSLAAAPVFTGMVSERPHLPLRPANLKVNDLGFGIVYVTGSATSVTATWATRNRLTEESIVLDWSASSTPPETGQTTVIVVCDEAGAELDSIGGLTGTSYTLDLTPYVANTTIRVFGYAERDSMRSLQAHELMVIRIVGPGGGDGGGEEGDPYEFEPNLLNPHPVILLASGDKFLVTRNGLAGKIGFYTYEYGDTELKYLTYSGASGMDTYVDRTTLYAENDSHQFVGLMRATGNDPVLRKLIYGSVPSMYNEAHPSFMPDNPPIGFWWTGTEFRAYLFDGTIWSSATGETWASEGTPTGGVDILPTTLYFAAAYIVVIGTKLALRYQNQVLYCADTDGMAWSPATGDIASLPTATYTDGVRMFTIASNGSRGVITAVGFKPGDHANYGLIYTSTDGQYWALVLEETFLGASNAPNRDFSLNYGDCLDGTKFTSFLYRLVYKPDGIEVYQPSDTQSIFDFGGGVELIYPGRSALASSKPGDSIGLFTGNGDTGFSVNNVYLTTDFQNFAELTWGDVPTSPPDPDFGNVVLLLIAQGTDGNTDIIDHSPSAHAVTVSGLVQVDTGVLIFGQPTFRFDGGTGDFLLLADHPDFDFEADDFTMEFIIYTPASYPWWLMGKGDSATAAGSTFSIYDSLTWDFYHGGSATSVPSISFELFHSYYWAVKREGGTISNYVGEIGVDTNTTMVGSASIGSAALNVTTSPLKVGYYGTAGFPGSMSCLRITKGLARDVSVVPTSQFPTS